MKALDQPRNVAAAAHDPLSALRLMRALLLESSAVVHAYAMGDDVEDFDETLPDRIDAALDAADAALKEPDDHIAGVTWHLPSCRRIGPCSSCGAPTTQPAPTAAPAVQPPEAPPQGACRVERDVELKRE